MLRCQSGGTLQDCQRIGKEYVHKFIENLNSKFHDVSTFNVVQLFNFKYYIFYEIEKGKLTKEWLNRLLIKLYVTMKNNMIKHEMNLLSL